MADEQDDLDPGLSDEGMDILVAQLQDSFGKVLSAVFAQTRDRDTCTTQEADDVGRAAVVALCLTLIVQCELGRRPGFDLTECVMGIVSHTLEEYGQEIQEKIKGLSEGEGESVH